MDLIQTHMEKIHLIAIAVKNKHIFPMTKQFINATISLRSVIYE